jgi:GrpB-like predicted nucleotidyltransferase (UPF0157 family)
VNKRKQIIEVVPYDPLWSSQFEEEAAQIKPIFFDNFVAIHHIGSTSVPGLASKPTIDIILEVNDIECVDECNDQMKNWAMKRGVNTTFLDDDFLLKEKKSERTMSVLFKSVAPR